MPLAAVVSTIEGHLAANWTRCEVRGFTDNSGETPDDGAAFLVVQYPFSQTEQITVGAPGANVFREEGGVRLVLNMPRDPDSRADALTWTDELAALFRGRHFPASGAMLGLTTHAPSSPVFDDASDDGNYLLLSVIVPYQADVLG